MNRLLLILFLFGLVGCKNFETKKLTSEQIMQEELENIDWKNLDAYPSFKKCEPKATEKAKKECFEEEITSQIFRVLGKHEVVLKDSVYERLELTIRISPQGKASMENLKISDSLAAQIPQIQEWIREALGNMPEVYPGEKRGIPVSSSFTLPLVIESQ